MSHIAEKARYHLEQSTPQLQSCISKSLLTPEEAREIATTRSTHELRVLAPRPSPDAWLAYIKWDIAFEALLQRRAEKQRTTALARDGQGRILNTFSRAVARHPASKPLWLAYLDYAAGMGAGRRWNSVWHQAIRLHARDAEMWILGATRAVGRYGDMEVARARFLNGARHCAGQGAAGVWVAYAKAELEWLGATEEKVGRGQHTTDITGETIALGGSDDEDDEDVFGDEGEEETRVPDQKQRDDINRAAAEQLRNSSVFEGAMPKAVFDVARKQGFFTARVARMFWEAFAEVSKGSRRSEVMAHVLEAMEEAYPKSPETVFCRIRIPLVGKQDAAWGGGFKETLGLLEQELEARVDPDGLVGLLCPWLENLSRDKKFAPFVPVIEGVRERISDVLAESDEPVEASATIPPSQPSDPVTNFVVA